MTKVKTKPAVKAECQSCSEARRLHQVENFVYCLQFGIERKLDDKCFKYNINKKRS